TFTQDKVKSDICSVVFILNSKRILRLPVFSFLWETGRNARPCHPSKASVKRYLIRGTKVCQ
uniref:Uncharacterized protein n=1 Tax=Acanthochromis polyacanthus TaxID=80966 RepID=A0A3Q1FDX9_9TELE